MLSLVGFHKGEVSEKPLAWALALVHAHRHVHVHLSLHWRKVIINNNIVCPVDSERNLS